MLQWYDSMLSEVVDVVRAPDLVALRERIRGWRFYDYLRTDVQSPARAAQLGTRTPILGHDGADLAAALQTITEIGDLEGLDRVVDRAFAGSRVQVVVRSSRFELVLHQPGMLRPLAAAELSDGTLRFLLLTAALFTPRPPELLVLNEPETSLHPDLLEPLASVIADAAARMQVVVVTHARPLVDALEAEAPGLGVECRTVELVKDGFGQTGVAGVEPFDQPAWEWPKR